MGHMGATVSIYNLMEDNTKKHRDYVNVGIGESFRDLAQRLVQFKNAVEGTKLSLRAYIERLIELDAAKNKNNPQKIDLSTLNLPILSLIEDNEPGKLPSYTLTADGKPIGQVQVTVTIDGQDASGKTWVEFEEAIEQGRNVSIDYTKNALNVE